MVPESGGTKAPCSGFRARTNLRLQPPRPDRRGGVTIRDEVLLHGEAFRVASCGQGEPHSAAGETEKPSFSHGLFMSHRRQPLMSNRAPPFPRLIQPCRSGSLVVVRTPATFARQSPLIQHSRLRGGPGSARGILDEPRMPKPQATFRRRSSFRDALFFFPSLREALADPG